MPKLFLSQSTLEEWALADKADLKEGRLFVPGEDDKTGYAVQPAVHFTKLVSGSDERKLVSKVKPQALLVSWGAEVLNDSAIIGDSAYQVVSGYIADVPAAAAAPKGTAPDNRKRNTTESDLLAAFILDKMS